MILVVFPCLLLRKFAMDLRLFLASLSLSRILLLLLLPLPVSTSQGSPLKHYTSCPENFECGSLGSLKFPYTKWWNLQCGFCMLDCDHKPFPTITFQFPQEKWFDVKSITNSTIKLRDPLLEGHLNDPKCSFVGYDIDLPPYPFIAFTILNNITLFKCNKNADTGYKKFDYVSGHKHYLYNGCDGFAIYFRLPNDQTPAVPTPFNCKKFLLPADSLYTNSENPELLKLLTPEFDLQWNLSGDCYDYYHEGQTCRTDWFRKPHCANAEEKGNKNLKVILGTVIPGSVAILIVLVVLLIWRHKKKISGISYFLSRSTSEPSSKLDLEGGSVYFGVPIFSYSELEKATNKFDASKELGDGGFGTVYHGKLRDGREVAVKRLYEHNFKRMEQFMTEVEILTRLRHRNLVALYGCTSRRSRELLLVYEYIPNGTVADHLHGNKAHDKYLTWSHRMNIAVETADALAYLHKSDIIHRDVKTNNILLDHNFCVKVADFGLSRLFPNDVSHISTAPQGTPGYVDPEYHQCYQLTDKSDVYSFGVVLIELVSSMPAVDISRHRHEVNLANLAINRIQRCAFDELIDPSLGYKADPEILRMTTSVAELAFRCLQLEKEMRPSMEEVLETLKEIQSSNDSLVDQTTGTNEKVSESRSRRVPPSLESEGIVLFSRGM